MPGRGVGGVAASAAALLLLLLPGLPEGRAGSAAFAEEETPLALVRRALTDGIRAGRPDAVAKQIAAYRVPATAARVGIECAILQDDRVRKAVAARDAHSKTMFGYYRAHFTKRGLPTLEEVYAYEALVNANDELGSSIRAEEQGLANVCAAARRRMAEVPPETPDTPAYVETLRQLVTGARTPTARAAALSAIGPAPVSYSLGPELMRIVLDTRASRAERVAAAGALSVPPDASRVAALAPALAGEDAFVRRALFRHLGQGNIPECVDALVGRVAKESGIPRDELLVALRRLTGVSKGPVAQAWIDWWAEARAGWTPPARQPGDEPATADADAAGATKFFGLDIRSARVLFILDRSWSMECGTLFDGRHFETIMDGEIKITLARRELTQAIRSLADDAWFDVIGYGTSTKQFAPKLVAATRENRARAAAWVEKLELDGATNLGGALIEAFESADGGPGVRDQEMADTIVVLSDGIPNCGPLGSPEAVIAEVARLNKDRMTTVHCVYLGAEGDASFMRKLAEQNGGQFVHYAK